MAFDANDPETKVALKAAIEKAVNEEVAGLRAKNTELINKLQKAQKDATIDPADYAALQAELDANETKLAEAVKELKTIKTENEKIKKAYEAESKVTHDLLVDTGLSTALLGVGVKKPMYLKAAKAMLAGQVVLMADGDKRVAKVGDKELEIFVKEWATTDEGKAFVDAPGNAGGGAHGGAGGSPDGDFSGMSPEARLQAINAKETTV